MRLILKKDLGMHAYHAQNHQELLDDDLPKRMRFAQWVTLKTEVDVNFPSWILFTDESTFTNKGTINRQNVRKWTPENPCWKIDVPNRGFRINVWAGIVGDRIVGPHFFDGTLTAEKYGQFLEEELSDWMPAPERRTTWFMQDGARVHTTRGNLNILRRLFGRRVISLRTAHPWPPRSPDLTPLDFFVWPYVKDRVYAAAPQTRDDMCDQIREVFNTITPEMLANVRNGFNRRMEHVLENRGAHIEHEM